MEKRSFIVGACLALAQLGLSGCGEESKGENVECGEGTMNVAGICVAVSLVDCGENTFEVAGKCVAIDPSDTQSPTTTVSPGVRRFRVLPPVVLQSDELATIYYTTDGSAPSTASTSALVAIQLNPTDGVAVRFFAVDPAGNAETEQSHTFTTDIVGPDPVAGLAAQVDASNADVTWTNPSDSDYTGVLLVRRVGQASEFVPTAGVFYSAGDAASDGTVVLSGNAVSLADPSPGTVVYYTAWTYDDLGNYSVPRSTRAVVQIGPQTATIVIDVETGGVTVNAQPANMMIAGTTQSGEGGLTMDMTLRNVSGRTLFGAKAQISNVVGGVVNAPPFNGELAVRFGPRGIRDGSERTRSFGVLPAELATEVSFDVEILNNPVLVTNERIYDPMDVDVVSQASVINNGPPLIRSALDKRGDSLFLLNRGYPVLLKSDLSIALPGQMHVLDPNFDDSTRSGSSFAIAVGSEAIFSALNQGIHWRGTDGNGDGEAGEISDTSLVRINPNTMEVVDTLSFAKDDVRVPAIRGLHLSQDESVLAVVIGLYGTSQSEVWFVNTQTMGIIDADSETPGEQGIALTGGLAIAGAWSQTLNTLYVAFEPDNPLPGPQDLLIEPTTMAAINVDTFAVTAITVPSGAADLAVRNGNIYYVAPAGLVIFPEAGGMPVVPDISPITDAGAIAFTADGTKYYVSSSSGGGEGPPRDCAGTFLFDAQTNGVIDINGDANDGVTGLENLCAQPNAGGLLMTPF